MGKTEKMNEIFNLPTEKPEENLPVEAMPEHAVESLKKNKEELNIIYRSAKKLLVNLIDDANEVGRARDIEVLTDFMKETSNLLTKIKDVDKDIIEINNGTIGDDTEKGKAINNFIFAGDTRDLMDLVKHVRKQKPVETEITVVETKE